MRHRQIVLFIIIAAVTLLGAACTPPPPSKLEETQPPLIITATPVASATEAQTVNTATDLTPTVEFTLSTSSGHDGLAFMGVGGDIDGKVNPTLQVNPGDVVKVTIVNGDGVMHSFAIDEFKVLTPDIINQGDQAVVTFKAETAGTYEYYCAVMGHRQAGMHGNIQVGAAAQPATGEAIIHNPADLPGPLSPRAPETVRVDLTVKEVVGQLADGTTYSYFTYNGTVPGPFIRVMQGDTIELHLKNDSTSQFTHSIDLHAVTGPGGGAVFTQAKPGEELVFTFKALNAGLFVYHCASPSIPHHISSGMYGLILVEPPGGLPKVDKEFYVMQGELYTVQPYGTTGHLDFDENKLSHETAEYITFNGAAAGLTSDAYALRAKVGETIRIFFGVGGPNYTSSFHVIGEIFDLAYPFASISSPPLKDVQTITVPPGGAGIVEFKVEVPGRYILVDHALARLERGLVGFLLVEGDDNPSIFKDGPAAP